jgi:hypothetical protein
MIKSNDTKEIDENKELDEIPTSLDYTTVPRIIENAVRQVPYEIEKESRLSWDTKQFVIRIPVDIAKEIGITRETKDDFKVRFKLVKGRPNTDEGTKLTMELIR